MKRRFTARPNPRSNGCVIVKPRLEVVYGLKALCRELVVVRELLKPTFSSVPGPKPCV